MSARKRAIAASFDGAAAGYDAHAALQARAADWLASGVLALGLPENCRMLEIGCGTGMLTARLAAALPGLGGVASDMAPAMVAACRARMGAAWAYAVMDAEAPCVTGGFDLVVGGMAAQWFEAPARSVAGLGRLLHPGGWLALSVPEAESLAGWRAACAAEGVVAPMPDFAAVDALVDGWRGRVMVHRTRVRLRHDSGVGFLVSLRGVGAAVPRAGHVPMTPGTLRRVLRRFEASGGAVADYALAAIFLRRDPPS